MSAIANRVYELIKELFPYNVIIKEHYVNYNGTRLFFDFFIKDLGVHIEVQGRQHFNFVKHFHETKERFLGQKKRDNLKLEYIEKNKLFSLVKVKYDEEITKVLLISKIEEVLDSKVGYV